MTVAVRVSPPEIGDDGVGVAVGVGVGLGVGVGVAVGVDVGVGVGVGVALGVGAAVGEEVGLSVGESVGVAFTVRVSVMVGVLVGVLAVVVAATSVIPAVVVVALPPLDGELHPARTSTQASARTTIVRRCIASSCEVVANNYPTNLLSVQFVCPLPHPLRTQFHVFIGLVGLNVLNGLVVV